MVTSNSSTQRSHLRLFGGRRACLGTKVISGVLKPQREQVRSVFSLFMLDSRSENRKIEKPAYFYFSLGGHQLAALPVEPPTRSKRLSAPKLPTDSTNGTTKLTRSTQAQCVQLCLKGRCHQCRRPTHPDLIVAAMDHDQPPETTDGKLEVAVPWKRQASSFGL